MCIYNKQQQYLSDLKYQGFCFLLILCCCTDYLWSLCHIVLSQRCQMSECPPFREDMIVLCFSQLSTYKWHMILPLISLADTSHIIPTSRGQLSTISPRDWQRRVRNSNKILTNNTHDYDCLEYQLQILTSLFFILHKNILSPSWGEIKLWLSRCFYKMP